MLRDSYLSIHQSVCLLVCLSVTPSHFPCFCFSFFDLTTSVLLPKWCSDLKMAPAHPHVSGVAVKLALFTFSLLLFSVLLLFLLFLLFFFFFFFFILVSFFFVLVFFFFFFFFFFLSHLPPLATPWEKFGKKTSHENGCNFVTKILRTFRLVSF